MNSMTGFGRAETDSKFGRFTVEISSVNGRFLESAVRLPRNLSALESPVRELLTSSVERGKVSVFVGFAESELTAGKVTINGQLIRDCYRELKRLQKELGLGGEICVGDLLMLPDIARPERTEPDLEMIWPVLRKGLHKALKQLLTMRAREGQAMATDMRKRLKTMAGLIRSVEKATAGAVERYAERLAGRIGELLNSKKHDPARLEEEIAIFAERTDIAEECLRFKSHIDQFLTTLGRKEAVGRRLNFILQEMNREANTIGSKGADFDISRSVISLKEDIEKLREQVQNVE